MRYLEANRRDRIVVSKYYSLPFPKREGILDADEERVIGMYFNEDGARRPGVSVRVLADMVGVGRSKLYRDLISALIKLKDLNGLLR